MADIDDAALVARLSLPAVVLDAAGKVIAVNEPMARCLGRPVDSIVGADLRDWARDRAAFERFLSLPGMPSLDLAFVAGDGREVCLALSYGAPSGPAGTLLIALDVTAREQRMRRAEADLACCRDMIRAGSDWFWEHDVAASRLRLVGRTGPDGEIMEREARLRWPDEVIDQTFEPEKFAAHIENLKAQAPFRGIVHRQIDSKGRERFIRSSGVPVFDEDGAFTGYRGISVDVTAQMVAERALQQSDAELRQRQQHLAMAQRVSRTASSELDLATGLIRWSDETYRLFGVARDSFELTPENFLALVHPDDRESVRTNVALVAAGQPVPPHEYRIVRPDGETRIVYREMERVFGPHGEPMRVVYTFKDVTEFRAAERRQQELERQLQAAQKLEALGRLAGGIAHDLNNTLVPILALAKMAAARQPAGSRERTQLTTIQRATEHARDLVQQILAFSRSQEIEIRRFGLSALVGDAVDAVRPSLPPGVSIVDRLAMIDDFYGDADQLRRVVTSLLTNAAQAMVGREGVITVTLDETPGTKAGLDAARVARLTVEDSGCGMDAATVARIFEPFFTTREVGQGAGLGLSVSDGVIARHGGRIEVRSRPGQGARFTVLLPIAVGPPQPGQSAPPDAA